MKINTVNIDLIRQIKILSLYTSRQKLKLVLGLETYPRHLSLFDPTLVFDRDCHEIFSIIRKTCPCDLYPIYTPILYSNSGVYRGIPCFLIFSLKQFNIDCGYPLEPPH